MDIRKTNSNLDSGTTHTHKHTDTQTHAIGHHTFLSLFI